MTDDRTYPGAPRLFEAKAAHEQKIITYESDGTAIILPPGETIPIRIPRERQFDLTQATIFGLNERLTASASSPMIEAGKTLRELFNDEWASYDDALEAAEGPALPYGVYAWYPRRNELVRFCPEFWHRIVATASTSMLFADPKGTLSWREVRERLESMTIGIAGASVGNNIAHAVAMDVRPRALRLADKSRYKMENINRVRLSYADLVESDTHRKDATENLLRNKSEVTAEQIATIDPFMKIEAFPEGLAKENIDRFFGGNGIPALDLVIEEVDDPRIKLFIREEARKRKIPVLMVSDLGSSVQLDVHRYDLDANLGLSHSASDEDLRAAMELVYDHPGDRGAFFAFVDLLIGSDYREGQLGKIIDQKTEIPTSTIIPQMGSTAMVAAGIMSEAVGNIRLGHAYPDRVFFNKRTFTITETGKIR
ncbi:MAG TPA: ThiF family adenylyltransferase [Candidatus Paceibacterota bacterium]|nr:ThiF family adenylyltransferase [Candidatus Paceibacterota bacterium]